MDQFNKSPQPNTTERNANFEALVAKDCAVIEARLKEISIRMLQEDISGEPNVGALEGISESNFSGLSGLKKSYDSFPFWYVTPKLFFKYLHERGGKKFRSLLLLNSYRMFTHGKEPNQEVVNMAVGEELVHETALILDDVIDNSTMRRGGPSLWVKNEIFKLIPSFEDSKGIAVDFGKLCFSWARHLMVDTVDEKFRPEAGKVFWQAVADMKHGEDDDNMSAHTSEWPPIEDVLEQFYLKTSSYSMRLPLLSALYASGTPVNDRILEGIESFSRGFGIAFQLHDDLLITKTTEEIGKDTTLDAFNGTKIPITILARQLGSEEEKTFIDNVWGKPSELTEENILKLKEIFKRTGAIQKIKEMIKLEVQKAESGLDIIAQSGFDVSNLRHLLNIGLPWMDDLDKQVS
ncbi:hypothetical protein A2W67_00165 [Candidatus Nomurabacteria bacterium RIFCSPLOWO2_02_40_28]|uniref:Polyprenyl synthetase n=2 Tax=Candidatus Nomuraibacteriota TaxID=1752729 RepID=A0A837HTX4_9BACT|nr:MAG: Polyprenyl synthetase [Candidatus Nomurabacteria bacterium GW2011_GWD2_39_12]KKR20221.1 MAG: Polyprenyl synthetase [Candidatus Nomurabacteria bacterium GW2011_GWC2_39_41]KKR36677.1 MAG: Polyprenyl synthetase [Candidatus Nomurabacteria bacterium GW2011_GWE2_40_10]KKR38118.1 MAG: Polyprenyl synthetase [Candidatus Nomurabacteria bacterium GW2011_GWB1_40_11]KKR39722.1 MAG: Polyprenyl synthetase [Parcubacteria group bacterium GW2011_GWC1_40_11]KKR74544.1 MAG: Polyprenyl synthetase [Candidat